MKGRFHHDGGEIVIGDRLRLGLLSLLGHDACNGMARLELGHMDQGKVRSDIADAPYMRH